MLQQTIKIILCDTSHPGNIGASARAMKTMGIYNLVLVNPKATIDDHAIALASNASDILLKHTTIRHSLNDAIADCVLAIATTSRKRLLVDEIHTPKQITQEIMSIIASTTSTANIQNITQNIKPKLPQVAIVFGSETNGLTQQQQELCNRLVSIPSNPHYQSLNLAQAVQIMCYEIYSSYSCQQQIEANTSKYAKIASINQLLETLQRRLKDNNYSCKNTNNFELAVRNLRHIIYKAKLSQEEANLLLGMLR